MEADWAVELGADDPVIVVPWQAGVDAPARNRFIDLRGQPQAIGEIEEATRQPALRSVLLALNHPQSKLWTAKCDVWSGNAADAIDRFEMDAMAGETKFSAGSYIDILSRDLEIRCSFAMQEGWIRALTAKLRGVALSCARTDFVLRHAEVAGVAGFGISWFVEGCGASLERAMQKWAEALARALPVCLDVAGGK